MVSRQCLMGSAARECFEGLARRGLSTGYAAGEKWEFLAFAAAGPVG